MKKLFYIAIIIPLLFSSCKKDPEPVVDTGLTDAWPETVFIIS